jgi:hypothetical protein
MDSKLDLQPSNIENFGRNLPFEANIYTLSQLFEDFLIFFFDFFASIKCILNSLESISIWYQVKAYSIENIPFIKYFDHTNHFIKDY